MPDIVAHGRREAMINACSLCHYPNGKGRPENAGVSGLPESYFIQTMMDFKNGLRKSTDARKGNTNRMAGFAKAMTDEEIHATAKYFGSIKWTPWMRVVETDTVPKTKINGGMYMALEGAEAGKEPIGQRIIEVPEKTEDTELLRNPHSGFVAYVPQGAIKKGQALVASASNKTTQCGVCHGADLEGLGPVPGLAGRSPSYVVRQLFDMQQGSRKGQWTDLMKPVVEKLSRRRHDQYRGLPGFTHSSRRKPIPRCEVNEFGTEAESGTWLSRRPARLGLRPEFRLPNSIRVICEIRGCLL